MMYHEQVERMSREALEQLQIERLQATLNRVYRNVAFYRSQFDAHGIDIDGVRTRDDIRRLPFTTKQDLRNAYPYDMFALPLRDIVRLHATSGTTGRPIVTGYTRNDVRVWSELVARQLCSVGISEHDVVQVAFAYGLFTGGLGFHYGAELLGASVIPTPPAANQRAEQIRIMKDYKATVLVSMPGYAMSLAGQLEQMDIHPEQLSLRAGIFGAEPWSDAMRAHLERSWHIRAFDAYGVTELMGPGVSAECGEHNGLHVAEDHFIVEVIDPLSREVLPHGQVGELVFTTLSREGFPLIRYRTGDLASLMPEPCPCGRTHARMSRVQGRTDDKVFFQGAHFFPSQVQEVLLDVEGVRPEYQIVLTREAGIETMDLRVAMHERVLAFDEMRTLVQLKSAIGGQLRQRLGIEARVSFVEAASLSPADGGKRETVVDRRNGETP